MAVKYLRLFDPTQQFLLKNGALNVAGLLKVKLEGTDDYAPVFDEDGTQLQQPVILDNNGRSKGLFVDSARVYWLEVDDCDGYELFTIRKMAPCGGGAGSALGKQYEVQSTDGTVSVDTFESDGVVYFDLSTATEDGASSWGATFGSMDAVPGTNDWVPVPVVSTAGSVPWIDGWHATKDCAVDIAASLEMAGDSSAISTVDVMCVFSVDGNSESVERSQLDPSESLGKVSFEYKGEVTAGQLVNCRIFVKSVEAMSPSLVAKIYFNEECDGVIGNAGADYYPGEYISINSANEISVTGVQPLSGMSAYQSAGDYAYNSAVSSKLDASASSNFYTTANESGYAVSSDVASALSLKADSSALTAYQPVSGMTAYQPTGDYAYNSAVSSKLEESAFTGYSAGIAGELSGISGELSGKADSSALTAYQEVSGMTAYALSSDVDSGLSGKLDASASSQFITALPSDMATTGDIEAAVSGKLDNSASSTWYPFDGNPSGFLTEHQELSGYVEKSAISAESAVWNGVTAKLDATASSQFITALPADMATTGDIEAAVSGKLDNSASSTWYPFDGNPSGFLTAHQSLAGYATEAYVDSSVSGKADSSALTAYQPTGDYAYNSAVSSKLDASASSEFYGTGNISGYVDSAYVDGQVSGKLDATASAGFYTTANESGYVDSAYVDSAVSGKQDTLTFDWDADSAISSINGSALAGQGDAQVVTSITTGGYGVRAINGMNLNASHMVFGAEAADNNSYVVKLGSAQEAGVFLTGGFGTAYYKVNELKLNRNGTGRIAFNIGGDGSQITATSDAGGKVSAGGPYGARSYFLAYNYSARASIEVTGGSAMVNLSDTGYTSTIYPSSIPYWNAKMDSAEMSAYVEKSAYDNLYSSFTALNDLVSQYSAYFSSISAKVDNSAIGVTE